MTADQLTIYRLQIQVMVRDVALEKLVATLKAIPGAEKPLRDWATGVREQAGRQTIPGLDPSMSMLVAGEYEAAVNQMMDSVRL